MANIPDFFYKRELYDIIIDIVKNSVTTVEDAELYMKHSKDYKRDSLIVKKMSNVGMSKNNILSIIIAMNVSDCN